MNASMYETKETKIVKSLYSPIKYELDSTSSYELLVAPTFDSCFRFMHPAITKLFFELWFNSNDRECRIFSSVTMPPISSRAV